jgi:predicted transcriptional regulator
VGEAAMRDRILEAIETYPGIHFRALVREVDTSTALAHYHLEDLVNDDEVRSVDVGGYTRYFPEGELADLTEEERSMLNAMRQKRRLELVLALIEGGPAPHKGLHQIVGGSKGTLSYHLGRLEEAGIVTKDEDGHFQLVDRDQVRRLLVRYEPESDLLDDVHDLWEDLFGPHTD